MTDQARLCLRCGIRVSWICLFISFGLAVMKCGIGILADSRALVANALYSLNDALSAAVALISLRVARQPADVDHAYGHGKAEFVAVGAMAFILALAVIFFLGYALPDIIRGDSAPPHVVALLVAAVTAGVTYFLARWGNCAAVQLGSPVLHTSAEHNRSDALSSLLTVVGVAGAMIGLRFLDPLVAILETLDVMRLSGSLLGSTLKGLMDTALPAEEQEAIRRAAASVAGVERVLKLRSRHAGSNTWLDLELQLSPSVSLEQAELLASEIRRTIHEILGRRAEIQVRFRSSPEHDPQTNARGAESHA